MTEMIQQLPTDAALPPPRRSRSNYLSTLTLSRRYSMPLNFLAEDVDAALDTKEEPIVTAYNSRAFFQRKSITSLSFAGPKQLEQPTKEYSRKSKWGYSPYSGTDSAIGAPDSSYKLEEISTSGKNRRSSQPISSFQRLFYSKMNSCPSMSSADSKTVSAGAEGDDNLSMDSFDGSGDIHANNNSVKSEGPTDDIATITPKFDVIPDKEGVDSGELHTVEDSEEATWSGFNLILQNGLEAALGQGLTTGTKGSTANSKSPVRGFRVKTSFSSKPTSFCLNGSTFPPEISAPNTPVTEAFSHFFSAPSFSYPVTPVHSAKCTHPSKQKVLTPRGQKATTPRAHFPAPVISQDMIQGAFADDSIESTQFLDSISQKSYYRQDEGSAPTYFCMVDSFGARRTVREIVRTWGLKLLRA